MVSATANMLPRELPAKGGAPVDAQQHHPDRDHGRQSPPPALSSIDFLFDKHGFVETKGVPVCTMAKLAGHDARRGAQALRRRARRQGHRQGARSTCPARRRSQISSPLSFFNGPQVGGKPSLIAHAYETVPVPKTLLVPIAIEKVSKGRYGYRVAGRVPEIADGYGAADPGRSDRRHDLEARRQEGRLPQRLLRGRAAAGPRQRSASRTATSSPRP